MTLYGVLLGCNEQTAKLRRRNVKAMFRQSLARPDFLGGARDRLAHGFLCLFCVRNQNDLSKGYQDLKYHMSFGLVYVDTVKKT